MKHACLPGLTNVVRLFQTGSVFSCKDKCLLFARQGFKILFIFLLVKGLMILQISPICFFGQLF